jgi:hypothetical protein
MKNKIIRIFSIIAFGIFCMVMLGIPLIKLTQNFSCEKLTFYLSVIFSAGLGATIGMLAFIIKDKQKRLHFIIFLIVAIIIGIGLFFIFNILNYEYLYLCCSNILFCGLGVYIVNILRNRHKIRR